jgi:hypothetical protein
MVFACIGYFKQICLEESRRDTISKVTHWDIRNFL